MPHQARRGESKMGCPDLYLLQWVVWTGLQEALGPKVNCVFEFVDKKSHTVCFFF